MDAALAGGHTVTLFNRGKSAPDMYPDLETIIGDRDGDLEGLAGRSWDCVIDTSGYVPRVVSDSATLLADHVKQYVFVSTKSVYGSLPEPSLTEETGEISTLEDPSVEEVTGETYGALKALCEAGSRGCDAGPGAEAASGLIVGPRDRSDRFTYWPVRIARGGEVLAPGSGEDYVQYIDVRDFAEWIIRCLQAKYRDLQCGDPRGALPDEGISRGDPRGSRVQGRFHLGGRRIPGGQRGECLS